MKYLVYVSHQKLAEKNWPLKCVLVCGTVCVFAQVKAEREWYLHLSQRKIAINFIISSHLYSQSQGAPSASHLLYPSPHLLSLSSASILKSLILLTLITVFPLATPYLFLSTLCLLSPHSVSNTHSSVCSFSIFIFPPHFCIHMLVSVVIVYLLFHSLTLSSDCWF